MCTFLLKNGALWDNLSNALWDFWIRLSASYKAFHDDVIKWKHFARYWLFVRGIHRSAVNSTHKGQWRGALIFSLKCTWINGWANNHEASDLRHHRAHYNDIVTPWSLAIISFCVELFWIYRQFPYIGFTWMISQYQSVFSLEILYVKQQNICLSLMVISLNEHEQMSIWFQ